MGDKKAIRFLTRALLEQYREDIARTSRTEVEALRRDSNLHSVWLREELSIALARPQAFARKNGGHASFLTEILRLPDGIAVPA
ncbi:MAG: hypothetical protein HY930_04825 [Euryarchaeota archaeon]|nr:hypothetical protein [Euryarchaeota archaeon]